MLNDLLYIVWDADPVMFSIGGFELRYYGLMWALTFLIGERFFTNFARREGFGQQIVETSFLWIVLGAVLGARIGHCLFYEFDYYMMTMVEPFLFSTLMGSRISQTFSGAFCSTMPAFLIIST